MANTVSKRSQNLSKEEMKAAQAVARGDAPCDLLIKNVRLLDLVGGEELHSAIAISGKSIAGVGMEYADAKAKRVFDAKGLCAVPGFIDGHLHIESSMMHPFEFERMVLPLGTTSAFCDPHEIANVMGEKGLSWFLRCSEKMLMNLFVQISSCVPALEGFETNGAPFELPQMLKYKNHSNVLGLAEMMNFPGVIHSDDKVLDKIEAFSDMNLDGHCPLLTGKALNAYLIAGIQNCHETVTAEEGQEKLQKGMALIIREGSVAKNLKTLAKLVTEFNSPQCFLCTDDRNPYEISQEGHINYLIKMLIEKIGLPVHVAYRLSSFSAAKHFGLKRLGLIAPGKQADIVLLKDLRKVDIAEVLIQGQFVSELNLQKELENKFQASSPPLENTIKRKTLKGSDFNYQLEAGTYNVIEIVPNEIITNHLKVVYDGEKFLSDDILKIAVVERYGHERKAALGLVKGMGAGRGALASSIAHDSHNLIVVGQNQEEMALAVNQLIESGGGLCVVEGKKVLAHLPLPIAGLMSKASGEEITGGINELRRAFKGLGVKLEEPFLQMAFLALPVIPSLKITDRGLVDVSTFKFTELRA